MNINDFIALISGLGLFLYGMNIMGDGLEKAAGDRMEKIIEAMTSNALKGVFVGTVVTGLIQSSSATTVMVIGFVNAGIMSLTQAVGVIMGANIGTTVTAQIIRLGNVDQSAWYLAILNPKTLTPLAIIIGVSLILFSKKKKFNIIGQVLAGFGILFLGMSSMENSVNALRDLPQFQHAFTIFQNPFIGVLIGAGITAIIQSSSASIGILQAAASTGLVTFASAVPIIMGQNIGTCITALLSSVGANKNAKRTAIIHLAFNMIGTVVFLIAIYFYQSTIGFSFWKHAINSGVIADFHTLFNLLNTLLLLPFAGLLVQLSHFFVGGRDEKATIKNLDERFLVTPSVAITQTIKEISNMFELAENNVNLSINSIQEPSINSLGIIEDNEDTVDEMESNITQYLVKIADKPLSEEENKTVSSLFHVITDIERIADHAVNLAETATYIIKEDIKFSSLAKNELNIIFNATKEIVTLAVAAYNNQDPNQSKKIHPCEDIIDLLKEKLRIKHIDRLSQQECNLKSGVIFLDIINNLERIADHCSNIAIAIEQMYSSDGVFDPHNYLRGVHDKQDKGYKELYKYFENKYSI